MLCSNLIYSSLTPRLGVFGFATALALPAVGCESEETEAEDQPAQQSVEDDTSAETEAGTREDRAVEQPGEQDDSDPAAAESERVADRKVIAVEESEKRSITAATTDVSEGEPLQRDHVEQRELPEELLPADPLLWEDLSDYVGRELDTDLSENNIIVVDHFRDPDEDSSSNEDDEIIIQR